MNLDWHHGLGINLATERKSEVIEMHLSDEEEAEEKALCGADASADYRRSVSGYLEDRLNDADVGTVCEGCKSRSIPFAVNLARDLEAEAPPVEAQEHRELAETLARETGQNPPGC